MTLLRIGAEMGSPICQLHFGLRLSRVDSVIWLRRAAVQGHGSAQAHLADAFMHLSLRRLMSACFYWNASKMGLAGYRRYMLMNPTEACSRRWCSDL